MLTLTLVTNTGLDIDMSLHIDLKVVLKKNNKMSLLISKFSHGNQITYIRLMLHFPTYRKMPSCKNSYQFCVNLVS